MRRCLPIAGLALALAAPLARADTDGPSGEVRLRADARSAATRGPLAVAEALAPGTVTAPADTLGAEIEWRHTLRTRAAGTPLALGVNALAWQQRALGNDADERVHGQARFNELHVAVDLGAWQLGAGKKVLGWDVGYGFRPNDFVQQEARRTLLGSTPEGRPLVMAEYFGSRSAQALVWVNPHHRDDADAATRGARESAWAWRGYWRIDGLDAYGFARWGQRTRASAGAAAAWVASDALELHASWRALQHHDGWRFDPAAAGHPVAANPWRPALLGATAQWLVGGQWTGERQQSVMLEYWHDGTTLADAQWTHWQTHNAALAGGPWPAAAAAGNLAWQATPMGAASLRRDNLYVRLAWQPTPWQLTLDALIHPHDRGRLVTAGVQWQGDRWRVDAAWRAAGGPAASLLAQVPTRRSVLLAATLAF